MSRSDQPFPLVRIVGWGDEKQLVAADDIETGVALLGEYPIAFIETRPDEDEIAPWLLLEGILSSPRMFEPVVVADLKMTKWPLSRDDEARLARLSSTYGRNPKKLAQLYHRVAANNLRYSQDGVTGFGIWPVVSRCNHSCAPNARVCATPRQPLVELLIASRPIQRDEPISWNYFSDDAFLRLDWRERCARLHRDFQFLCRCPRCESERPPEFARWSRQQVREYFRREHAP